MASIFDFDDYVDFLEDWILSRPKRGRGVKTEMAIYMGCLPAHITKVLNRDVHFTLEQAAKILTFLELSKVEGHYFLNLVEFGRAGNSELRSIISERLEEIKSKSFEEKKLDISKNKMAPEDIEVYFSTWHYLAAEMLTSIEKYQTIDAICECLELTKNQAMKVMNFLVERNFIRRDGNRFIKDFGLHSVDSPGPAVLKNYHKNWRTRALVSLDQDVENNLNFSWVVSMPKEVIPIIKTTLIEKIKEMNDLVMDHPADPDGLQCLTIDFFKLSSPNVD